MREIHPLLRFTIALSLLIGTCAHAESRLSHSVLQSEDESMIVKSAPLQTGEAETPFAAKAEDLNRSKVVIIINKAPHGPTAQTMRVFVDGKILYRWKISTGREKTETATSGRVYFTTTEVGYFHPYLLEENHHSKTWDADMPYAIFFDGGIATHATTHEDHLGHRASGGCVRNTLEHAKTLYELVENIGQKEIPMLNHDGSTKPDSYGDPLTDNLYDVLIIVENRV